MSDRLHAIGGILDRARDWHVLSDWFSQRRPVSPSLVASIDDLPLTLLELVLGGLPSGVRPQSIVVAPADYYSRGLLGWSFLPERVLVFAAEGVLYAQAASPGGRSTDARPPVVRWICAADLLYVRSSLLLLYGALELVWSEAGAAERVLVEYNTSGWGFLKPGVLQLVDAAAREAMPAAPRDPAEVGAARAANDLHLKRLPFKFGNGLRYYVLQGGERLLAAVFQPALWTTTHRFFHRALAPNSLIAATNRTVVLIEEQRVVARNETDYSWVFTYIPLPCIESITLEPRDECTCLLFGLRRGGATAERRFLMDREHAAEWQAHWDGLRMGARDD